MFSKEQSLCPKVADQKVIDIMDFWGATVDWAKEGLSTEDFIKAIGTWVTLGLDVEQVDFYPSIRVVVNPRSFMANFAGDSRIESKQVDWFGGGHRLKAEIDLGFMQITSYLPVTERIKEVLGC